MTSMYREQTGERSKTRNKEIPKKVIVVVQWGDNKGPG